MPLPAMLPRGSTPGGQEESGVLPPHLPVPGPAAGDRGLEVTWDQPRVVPALLPTLLPQK